MRIRGRIRNTVIILLVGLLVSACKSGEEKPLPTLLKLPEDGTVTPQPNVIFITATPETPIPIVATETPSLMPEPGTAAAPTPTDVVAVLPTQPATRTATSTQGPPATLTPSFTPTETDTPVTPGAGFSIVGAVPGEAGSASVSGCATMPSGGFGNLFQSDPNIQAGLGCPLSGAATSGSSAYQPFDNGVMFWVSSLGSQPQPVIYVLYNNGTYQRYNDTFVDGVDPSSSGAVAPEGRLEPVRGFGKVWRDIPGVRDTLGWATSGESGGSMQIQLFERGEMVFVSQSGQTYILLTGAPGTWSARAGGY